MTRTRLEQVQRAFGEVIKSPFTKLKEEADLAKDIEDLNKFQSIFK